MLSYILSALFVLLTSCSPFDPHVAPVHSPKPFFEGWYTRVVDPVANVSVAIIVGSFQPIQGASFTQNWLALLLEFNQTITTVQAFAKEVAIQLDGHNVTHQPNPKVPANFLYRLPEFGFLSVRNNAAQLSFEFPGGYSVGMNLTRRVPWNPAIPDGDGPEGWLEHLDFLLPCHYYVETFGSLTSYSVVNPSKGLYLKGTGYSHQETNYGESFPSSWVWAQGSDSSTHFVLTSGKFIIAGKETLTSILALRTPTVNVTFRTTDGDLFHLTKDPCNGILKLSARSLLHPTRVDLTLSAARQSFSAPLYCPNSTGFHDDPGSVESFRAEANITVSSAQPYQHASSARTSMGSPVSLRVAYCALEFGGADQCPH